MVSRRPRLGKLRDDLAFVLGEWVRLPDFDGLELCQQSGRPMVVQWFPYGKLPNGVTLLARADLRVDDGRLIVPGYWDLSLVRRHCLIRYTAPADPPPPADGLI